MYTCTIDSHRVFQVGDHIQHGTHVHQSYRVTESLPVTMDAIGHHFSHLCDGLNTYKLQSVPDPGLIYD